MVDELYSSKEAETTNILPPMPVPLTPLSTGIPADLKRNHNWVGWWYAWNGAKWTKEPLALSGKSEGKLASSTGRWSWSTYVTAADRYAKYKRVPGVSLVEGQRVLDGIGYCLDPDTDNLVGIDLDGCRDRQTGEIQAWATAIVDSIASYTEVSPSGTGVRIFCRGKLPGPGRTHIPSGREIYDRGRYLTVTGHHLPRTPTSLQTRQEQIEAFYASIPSTAPAAKRGVSEDGKPVAVASAVDHDEATKQPGLSPPAERKQAAREYLATRRGAQQGKGADNYCYALARSVAWGFLLPPEDAIEVLTEWGERDDQYDADGGHYPWTEKEVARKVSAVIGAANRGEPGDLLDPLAGTGPRLAELFPGTPAPAALDVAEYLGVDPEDLAHAPQPQRKPKADREKASVAEGLIALAESRSELWHDRAGGWASVQVDGHPENRRVRSAAFREWLVGTWFDVTHIVANDKAVRSALEVIEHKAKRGPQHATHLRWARAGNALYCDLGTPTWEAVEIDAQGWRIIPRPPVKFRRTAQTAPMPTPTRGGTLDALRPLVASTDEGWEMIRGFILDATKAYGPYFVLSITGEQGSAKSSTCRIVRRVIDPVTAGELSSLPKDESDFGVTAQHEAVLAFDNVSHLKADMSDVLCRASTGGGIKTRRLYSDDELSVLPICCPVVINGIPDVATANDLISRSLIVAQPLIPQEARRDEKALDAEFARVWPGVFGALLDRLSRGCQDVATVTLAKLPRMADSCRWVTACLGDESFVAAHAANEDEAVVTGLDASPTARLLRMVVNGHGGKWQGTAEALLTELKAHANVEGTNGGELPRSAKGLSGIVRRDAPALRSGWGWTVETVKTNGTRLIRLAAPAVANG